ncbi:GNAT family N-acetyltransferase [Oxyplasma meridianum]|uniref:GNAT family N-acetyltransferase n=1 Tax=Oxyplasma meridianum TaxID=3073602 RepID=A0AAX4NH84_9ARCH
MPVIKFTESRNISLPKGFRQIRKDDVNKPFSSHDVKMRGYNPGYFYQWSLESDTLVLVKEGSFGYLDGIILLRFIPGKSQPDKMMIEMLSRNFQSGKASSGVGNELLRIAENNIASSLGVKEIIIDAVSSLVDYYTSMGYVKTGKEEYDQYWGNIVYMHKYINNH